MELVRFNLKQLTKALNNSDFYVNYCGEREGKHGKFYSVILYSCKIRKSLSICLKEALVKGLKYKLNNYKFIEYRYNEDEDDVELNDDQAEWLSGGCEITAEVMDLAEMQDI